MTQSEAKEKERDTPDIKSVSVVIPCFNAGEALRDAVASVRSQSGDFVLADLIVIDDASDDPVTKRILQSLSLDRDVTVEANKGPKGPGGARNTGIDIASGRWIAFLDADDVMCDGAIQARLDAVQKFEGCRWVGGDCRIWNEDGTYETETFFASRTRPRKILASAFETGAPILLKRPVAEFIESSLTNMCSTMIERSLLNEVGCFDPNLRLQQDFHLFIRLARVADFVFVPETVMYYRQHSGNSTRSTLRTLQWRESACRKLKSSAQFRDYESHLNQKISEICREISIEQRRSGSVGRSIAAAGRGVFSQPFSGACWKRLAASLALR